MRQPRHLWTIAFVLLLGAATAEARQLGGAYEDGRIGFSVRPPKEWNPIPGDPLEPWVVVKFHDPQEVTARKAFVGHNAELTVMHFVAEGPETGAAEPADGEGGDDIDIRGAATSRRIAGYDEYLESFARGYTVDDKRTRKLGREEATYYEITQKGSYVDLKRICAVFPGPRGAVALEFIVMAEHYEKKFKREIASSLASFRWTEVAEQSRDLSQLSDDERFIEEQIARLPPGWYHDWSPRRRYMVVSNADKGFVRDLAKNLEAIRDVYEQLYPPEKPITAVSIVRVCNNRDEYIAYGGPPGSAGYWNWVARELVFYDNKASNRKESIQVLYHEAFHQYIYYYYGEIAPHSWYNEGHGDYFSGAVLVGGRIKEIKPFQWREPLIKDAIREGRHKPLKELMGYTQAQYYADAGLCYAEGWSIVWFLREGARQKKLQPKWEKILPDYLDHLVAAFRELSQDKPAATIQEECQKRAYEATFADWTDADWAEFEEAWKKFIG